MELGRPAQAIMQLLVKINIGVPGTVLSTPKVTVQLCGVNTIIIPILQMRKMRHRATLSPSPA